MPHQKLSGSSPKSATAASDEERFRGSKVWGSSLIPASAIPHSASVSSAFCHALQVARMLPAELTLLRATRAWSSSVPSIASVG